MRGELLGQGLLNLLDLLFARANVLRADVGVSARSGALSRLGNSRAARLVLLGLLLDRKLIDAPDTKYDGGDCPGASLYNSAGAVPVCCTIRVFEYPRNPGEHPNFLPR